MKDYLTSNGQRRKEKGIAARRHHVSTEQEVGAKRGTGGARGSAGVEDDYPEE